MPPFNTHNNRYPARQHPRLFTSDSRVQTIQSDSTEDEERDDDRNENQDDGGHGPEENNCSEDQQGREEDLQVVPHDQRRQAPQSPTSRHSAVVKYPEPSSQIHPIVSNSTAATRQHAMPNFPAAQSNTPPPWFNQRQGGHRYGTVTIEGEGHVIRGNAVGNNIYPWMTKNHEYGDVKIAKGATGTCHDGDVPINVLGDFWGYGRSQR